MIVDLKFGKIEIQVKSPGKLSVSDLNGQLVISEVEHNTTTAEVATTNDIDKTFEYIRSPIKRPKNKKRLCKAEVVDIFNATIKRTSLAKRFGISATHVANIQTGLIHSKVTGKIYTGIENPRPSPPLTETPIDYISPLRRKRKSLSVV